MKTNKFIILEKLHSKQSWAFPTPSLLFLLVPEKLDEPPPD